jgi:hypothetical protein
MSIPHDSSPTDIERLGTFDDDLLASTRTEASLVWKELAALLLIAAVIVFRAVWLG